ncbi:hypothetical protein KUCAC02_036609, partial [Chaenocephalus aceratus]
RDSDPGCDTERARVWSASEEMNQVPAHSWTPRCHTGSQSGDYSGFESSISCTDLKEDVFNVLYEWRGTKVLAV